MLETFEVKSGTTDVVYKVTTDGKNYTCECPWSKHHPDFACSCKRTCGGKNSIHYCKHVTEILLKEVYDEMTAQGKKLELAFDELKKLFKNGDKQEAKHAILEMDENKKRVYIYTEYMPEPNAGEFKPHFHYEFKYWGSKELWEILNKYGMRPEWENSCYGYFYFD